MREEPSEINQAKNQISGTANGNSPTADSTGNDLSGLAKSIAPTVSRRARLGDTRHEIQLRLENFRPGVDASAIASAIDLVRDQDDIRFNKAKNDSLVSKTLLEASLLFAVGQHFELPTSNCNAEEALDQEFVRSLSETLSAEGVNPEATLGVLKTIYAAQRAIDQDAQLTISKSKYDAIRAQFISDNSLVSDQGRATWPIGSITILKRLGGSWNSALAAVGLSVSKVPAGFGAATYAPEDYQSAIHDFKKNADADQSGQTYADYENWVEQERAANRARPSAPAVRGVFPSWNEAIRQDGNAEQINRVTERRLRIASRDAGPTSELIRAKENELDRIVDEIEERTAAGTLAPEEAAHLEEQRVLTAATIARYEDEQERWAEQKRRWAESDIQADRQFKINFGLAVAIGIGSVVVPLLVWVLETFVSVG